MNDTKMEEIIDLYNTLGIAINEEAGSSYQDTAVCLNPTPFGIYTENGFNYSNNTNH